MLAALLSAKYLHQEIREKGGAYGGGAVAQGGTFTYYSYRDPKNLETFSVYRGAAEWASRAAFTSQVMTILISFLDVPDSSDVLSCLVLFRVTCSPD